MNKAKLILGLSLSLFLIILPLMPVHADPVLNTNSSSKSLNYGSGYFAILFVDGLVSGTEYILMVANNTNDAYNITFTATSSRAEINVDYKGTIVDLYNNSLTELQLMLVEGSTIHWTHYIILNYDNTLASLVQWLIDIFIFTMTIGLSGILVILIGKKI